MKKFSEYKLIVEKQEKDKKEADEMIHLPELYLTKEALNEYLKRYNLKLEKLK